MPAHANLLPVTAQVINALNSGANVYMADFEDSNCPTWANLIEVLRQNTPISASGSGAGSVRSAATHAVYSRPARVQA